MTSGQPQLTKVTINGITVDAYLATNEAWKISTTSDLSTVKIVTIFLSRAVSALIPLDATLNEKPVTIQRGVLSATEQYEFKGVVINVIPNGGVIKIIAADQLYLTTKNKVTTSYDINVDAEAGKYSEIFKSLINDYTNLTADATSIQDSGSIITINRFVCRAVPVFDRLKALSDAIGWQFYYNPNTDLVYFEPKGSLSQSSGLSTGVNIVESPKWNYDSGELFNKVELRGAVVIVETNKQGRVGTDSYATTAQFLLDFEPFSIKVFSDATNPPTTLRAGGIKDSSDTYDYSINTELQKIEWNTSTYAPSTSDYVLVQYSYAVPAPVVLFDQPSIDTIKNDTDDGIREIVIHRKDILDVADAEVFATQYLEDHKDPIQSAKLRVVNVSDLEVGQVISVNDTFNGVNDEFFIVSITKRYPYRYDELEIVSNIIDEGMYDYNINQRVKRLEEQNQNDSEVLLHVIGGSHQTTLERRYGYLEQTTYVLGDSVFILGDSNFGVLGTNKLGDSSGRVPSIIRMVQGKNTYKEFVYDEDFYDDSSSTGVTWNTTSKEITIAAEGILYTTKIFLGTQYGFATPTLQSTDLKDLDIDISADGGSTYQQLTNTIRTELLATDTNGIILRLTNPLGVEGALLPALLPALLLIAGDDIILANTYKDSLAYNKPAIQLLVEES